MNANIDVIMGNRSPAEVLEAYDDVLAVLDALIAADPSLSPAFKAAFRPLSPDHFARGGERDLELRDEMFGEVDDDSEGDES